MTREITGHTRVFALLGSPVAHSESPRLHNAWFEASGLDAVYVALETPPGTDLAPLLGGLAGANLTIPHKTAVVPLLDEWGPDVEATGAANTVVRRERRLVGRNTDVEGLGRAVDELGLELAGTTAVVLGAGGAGRAVVAALARRSVRRVVWLNRSQERLSKAIAASRTRLDLDGGDLAAFSAVAAEASLVVNATSGAASRAVEALDVDRLPESAAWVDLNYWMPDPPALERAAARGLRTQRGDRMLWHQAVLAFEAFTGREAPVLPG
jgi:shikimate dehydrogenase